MLCAAGPATAQQGENPKLDFGPGNPFGVWLHGESGTSIIPGHALSAPIYLQGTSLNRPPAQSSLLAKPSVITTPGTIAKMEAAFYCNDTPFIDQVRLPVASFLGGHVKLVWLESDVTTANFVLGLPGAGTLSSLSMFGSGHLAIHTPPSDELTGVHMTFQLHGGETSAQDNSGLRGMQYLVRASRDFFQTLAAR